MKEIKLSQYGRNKGKYVALVDDEDYEYLNQWNWSAHNRRGCIYAERNEYNGRNKKIVILHRIIMNVPKDILIDHIDRNSLNNQKSNLRICTQQQNIINRRVSNKTGYKGVKKHYKDNAKNPYVAQICFNYKKMHIGCFKTKEDAARAYDKKAVELFGEFANLNFK